MTDEDQIETHRDRWLALFVGGYSMIGVVAGIGVGVASTLDKGPLRTAAIYCGLICVLFVTLLFWLLRRFYDFLGFGKQPATEEAMKQFAFDGHNRARRDKKVRKLFELFAHLFLFIHLALLAWGLKEKEANSERSTSRQTQRPRAAVGQLKR